MSNSLGDTVYGKVPVTDLQGIFEVDMHGQWEQI